MAAEKPFPVEIYKGDKVHGERMIHTDVLFTYSLLLYYLLITVPSSLSMNECIMREQRIFVGDVFSLLDACHP